LSKNAVESPLIQIRLGTKGVRL